MAKKINGIIILLMISVLFVSVGYSAFNSRLLIDGLSIKVKLEKDVKVTAFTTAKVQNKAVVNNISYTDDELNVSVKLPNKGSTATFKVDATNFGNVEMGIESITGSKADGKAFPAKLTYDIVGYNMKDKICDANKCVNNATKVFKITVKYLPNKTPNKAAFNLKFKLIFKPVYNVSYVGIQNNDYPVTVMKDDTLKVTFTGDIPSLVKVMMGGQELVLGETFTYANKILTVNNVVSDIVISKDSATPDPDPNIPQTKDMEVKFNLENKNGNSYAYRIDITNKTNKKAKGLEIYLKVPDGSKVPNMWGGVTSKIENGYLILTFVNAEGFPPNQSRNAIIGVTIEVPEGVTMPDPIEYTSKAIYE